MNAYDIIFAALCGLWIVIAAWWCFRAGGSTNEKSPSVDAKE